MTEKDKIDVDLILALSIDAVKYIKKISTYIPNDQEPLMKNLAAAAVHMQLFAKDLLAHCGNIVEPEDDQVLKFFKNCGCAERCKKFGVEINNES